MAGLVPAIHVLGGRKGSVDARPKACARAGRGPDPGAGMTVERAGHGRSSCFHRTATFESFLGLKRHARTKREQQQAASMQSAYLKPANDPDNTLVSLRKTVARIEGYQPDLATGEARALAFGMSSLDRALAGGLAPAALHEITPAAMTDLGSAVGFTLALAARAAKAGQEPALDRHRFRRARGRRYLWPRLRSLWPAGTRSRDRESRARRPTRSGPWKRRSNAARSRPQSSNCRTMRRSPISPPRAGSHSPRAKAAAFGFLLRHRASALTSSAETRWRVAAAPAIPDRFGGLGRAIFFAHPSQKSPWPDRPLDTRLEPS